MTIFEYIGTFLVIAFLCSARVTVAMQVVPFFGSGMSGLPRTLLFAICQVVAVPTVFPSVAFQPIDVMTIGAVALKEGMIGLLLGVVAGILFWAIDSAAELIDLQRGATSAGVFNPQFGTVSSPTAGLFSRLISAVFYAIGGFFAFLAALFASYELYPVMSYFPEWSPNALNALLEIFGNYFKMTVLYAAPLLTVFFMLDFGLGMMNRFVPNLNVFFLSLPIKSALCFFMLIFYIGFLVISFRENLFTPAVLEGFFRTIFE